MASFRRFRLNQWTAGAAEPWINPALYDQAEDATPEADLLGRACWIGVDLSSVEDLTAVVAVFPTDDEAEARRYDVVARFFLPEAGIVRKAADDQADYLRWTDAGFLTLTPGNVVDQRVVLEAIEDLGERYAVQEVAIDRWNSTAITTALAEAGFTVAAFGQGFGSIGGAGEGAEGLDPGRPLPAWWQPGAPVLFCETWRRTKTLPKMRNSPRPARAVASMARWRPPWRSAGC